jgi:hypothetical protein
VVEREQQVDVVEAAIDVARREDGDRVAARRDGVLQRADARLAEREVAMLEAQPEPGALEARHQHLLDPCAIGGVVAPVHHEGVVGKVVERRLQIDHGVVALVRGFGDAQQGRARRAQPGREVAELDRRPAGQRDRLLEDLLQLAHVARPRVAQQSLQDRRRQLGIARARIRNALEHGVDEQAEILSALAQGWHLEPAAEAIEELGAKPAVVDPLLEIALGCRHDAQIDAELGRAADRPQRLLLEHPQELALQRGWEVTDFVEEQRAPGRRCDQPVATAGRAGERAADVTEQLALEARFRQTCTVDRHERPAATGQRVDGTREQLLPAAARALQHDRRLAAREPRQPAEPLEQRGLHRPQAVGAVQPVPVMPRRAVQLTSHRCAEHEERPPHLDQIAVAEHRVLVAAPVHPGSVLGAVDQLPGRPVPPEDGVPRRHPAVDDADVQDARAAAQRHVGVAPCGARQPHLVDAAQPEAQWRLARAPRLRHEEQAGSRAESPLAGLAGTHRESTVNALFHQRPSFTCVSYEPLCSIEGVRTLFQAQEIFRL